MAYTQLDVVLKQGWNFISVPLDDSVDEDGVMGEGSLDRLIFKINKDNPDFSKNVWFTDKTHGWVEEIRVLDAITGSILRFKPSENIEDISKINGFSSYFIKIRDNISDIVLEFKGVPWVLSDNNAISSISVRRGDNWINLIQGTYRSLGELTAVSGLEEAQEFVYETQVFKSNVGDFDTESHNILTYGQGIVVVASRDLILDFDDTIWE